jgi:hypothetical protein
MHRVKRAGNYANIPAPPAGGTPGYFGPGDPGTNTPATIPGYDWFNAVQEEIIAPILAAGLALDEADRGQLLEAIPIVARTGYMLVRDEKPQGTHGGTATANTTAVRTLNTVAANTIAGASLAANQITLPAGSYRSRGWVPGCHVNLHRAGLYNVTDSAYAILGTSENGSTSTSDPTQTQSIIVGRLTLAGATVFEVRHYTADGAASTGLGNAVNQMGNEIYTVLEITKE